jgi:AcrR family transcriptional regulator
MGNREDLVAGALVCLKEKGWSRTTVRDIATAAGVNHAAIGYHFGSREALLTEAFIKAIEEWGGEIEKAVIASLDPDASPREQYEAFWRETIASFGRSRQLWLATVEAAIQAEYTPKIRELMREGIRQGRSGFAASLLGVPEDSLDGRPERTIGSIQMALMSGVLIQWIIDPERAPSETDIADGIRALSAHIGDSPRA